MKSISMLMALVLAAGLAAAGGAVAEENDAQKGTGGDCLDYHALWIAGIFGAGVHGPNAAVVTVDDDTGFTITSEGDKVAIDFFAQDGTWVGWNEGGETGDVPVDAAYGIVCVRESHSVGGVGVYLPAEGTPFTYQDGFPVSTE